MMRAVIFDFMGVVGFTRMAVAGDPGTAPVRVVMVGEVVDEVQRVRSLGYRTALLSNNDRSHFETIAPDVTGQFPSMFDVVVYSSDVGVEKPHPRMFEEVLRQLDIDAESALYLDDVLRNVEAAQHLGMTARLVSDPLVDVRSAIADWVA